MLRSDAEKYDAGISLDQVISFIRYKHYKVAIRTF